MDCGKKMKAGGKVPPFAAKKAAPAKGGKPNPFADKKAPPFGKKKEPAFAGGGTVRGMGAATKGGKFSSSC